MRFFVYARKSTDDEERQILSIQAQLDELRELARKESLTVAREYIEAQTAKEPGRPVFNEMMKALEKGEAQAILAWHPDRLARNSIDGGRVIYDLDTGKVATLKFPTHWFENTPQGKFMLQIAFGQSKYYVDNLSENIKRGIRKKLRDGVYHLPRVRLFIHIRHTEGPRLLPMRQAARPLRLEDHPGGIACPTTAGEHPASFDF
jgi:DNA invertase Pin-like site-specific DNA recombinase